MNICYIGIGGNLGDSAETFNSVIQDLKDSDVIVFEKVSSFYRTKPLDDDSQPEYLNAVIELRTNLSAYQLLDSLQALEAKYGRVRTNKRWDSRTIDLDILLYGQQVINDARLEVPHREMHKRDFVLFPLYEIAPELNIPGLGSLQQLISRCEDRGMKKL